MNLMRRAAAALTSLGLGLAAVGILAGPAAAGGGGCTTTDFFQDGGFLTAALVDPGAFTGALDAGGCDIGVYFDGAGSGGSVSNADITNARYYGVLVSDGATANVTDSTITDINDNPLDGSQHGVGIAYRVNTITGGGGSGTASGNTVSDYQKDGILANGGGTNVTISDNTVTGIGPTSLIAQNGIQVSRGATATVTGNTVSGNIYTQNGGCAPAGVGSCVGVVSTGILFFEAGTAASVGELASTNHAFMNQSNITVIQ
jgi:hypothetical protein